MKTHLLLLILLLPLRAFCDSERAGDFRLLSMVKQAPQPLPYFLRHAPTNFFVTEDAAVPFGPLPAGQTAHLASLGGMSDSRLFSVRYLSDERLTRGNIGAVGMVVLASIPSDQKMFVPLIAAGGVDEGLIRDYGASEVRMFGTTAVVWVRREDSGNAHSVHRMALMADITAGMPMKLCDPIDAKDPLDTLKKQGWEHWTRGNFFDEETLTWHYRLYQKPKPNMPDAEYPHRYYSVRYNFKGGKFVRGKPVRDPQGQ